MDIAILGYGTVGSGTVTVLDRNREIITEESGEMIRVKAILDLRDFPGDPYEERITHNFEDILKDPAIEVVAETMGGLHPTYEFVSQLLEAGKSVVTSNKDLVAAYGAKLLEIAVRNHVDFFYEASVGGGIPIIRTINQGMIQEQLEEIMAILNGTTNYILTKMEKEGTSFKETLEEAQKLGYAELNPASDVEGMDAARKLAILSTRAYSVDVDWETIERRGITEITKEDIAVAKAIDRHIKLIGRSRMVGETLYAGVEPMLLSEDHKLVRVEGVYNKILFKGNMVDDISIEGRGAGSLPTGSAVAADIIMAVINKKSHVTSTTYREYKKITPESFSSLGQSYMLRTNQSVSMPQDGISASIQVEDIYAYFTKQIKAQELRDLVQQLENKGIQVLNCLAMDKEESGVNR